MLMPKRAKHRKQFRGNMAGKASRGNKITYGEYGIVATEPCWIKSNQIEAARIAMTRYIKRGGKVWIKIFPDKPVSAGFAVTGLFGLRFSQTSQLQQSLLKLEWVQERVHLNIG